jgi:hypothetical protein
MKPIFKLLSVVVIGALVISCGSDDDKEKTRGFNSPDEFMENSSVASAITESGFQAHQGTAPPDIAGKYEEAVMMTAVCIYNQNSGTVDYAEKETGAAPRVVTGSFITGQGDDFTIWQECEWNYNLVCPPLYTAVLYKGTRQPNEDIEGSRLRVILEVGETTDDPDCKPGVYDHLQTWRLTADPAACSGPDDL